MKWEIKRYSNLTADELHDIMRERVNVFVVEQQCPYPEIDGYDKEAYHLLAKRDDEIVAYARMFPKGTKYEEASVGRVLVKKEYRGAGLAKELLEQALSFLQYDLGESAVKIQAQYYLISFYRSFGFQSVTDVYDEDGIPHVDMVLLCKK